MVSAGCLKILFPFFTTVLFFRISRSPFHCALSASIVGSISHPVGDRPSHPICEVGFSATDQPLISACRNRAVRYDGTCGPLGPASSPSRRFSSWQQVRSL